MTGYNFTKLEGTGNDFILFDERMGVAPVLDMETVLHLCERRRGIGCDQLLLIGDSEVADVALRIWNCDGSEVKACGNATRAVATLLFDSLGKDELTIQTGADILHARKKDDGTAEVDMGAPRNLWQQIPLQREVADVRHLGLDAWDLQDGSAVGMGNPHVVFFTEKDPEDVDLQGLAPQVQEMELFSEGVNVGLAHVVSPDRLRLRVYERGAGETLACGTGACAAFYAAYDSGKVGDQVTVETRGGMLSIRISEAGRLHLSGPVRVVFKGTIEL